MEYEVFEGKDILELKQEVLSKLDKPENELFFQSEEKKGGLFKGSKVTLKVYTIETVTEEIKKFLTELLTNMGITATFETKIREGQINIKMYSDKNNILIGKNGQTLQSLQIIIRQHIYQQISSYPYILLDVENYKEKQQYHLERLAKDIAREVSKTKQEVIMDNMNSYERRIVHNIISKFDNVTTISEGEEPNRHIVVKPKED